MDAIPRFGSLSDFPFSKRARIMLSGEVVTMVGVLLVLFGVPQLLSSRTDSQIPKHMQLIYTVSPVPVVSRNRIRVSRPVVSPAHNPTEIVKALSDSTTFSPAARPQSPRAPSPAAASEVEPSPLNQTPENIALANQAASPAQDLLTKASRLPTKGELKNEPTVRIFDESQTYLDVLRGLGRKIGFVCGEIHGGFVPLTLDPRTMTFGPGTLLDGMWPREFAHEELSNPTLHTAVEEATWKLQCSSVSIRGIVLWSADDARLIQGAIVDYLQTNKIDPEQIGDVDVALVAPPLKVVVLAVHKP